MLSDKSKIPYELEPKKVPWRVWQHGQMSLINKLATCVPPDWLLLKVVSCPTFSDSQDRYCRCNCGFS
ncbi:hypothetical protein CEXT_148201 [Caerostris extrusa]|uniref:Uncharacterized protein n=1 Tax=Caerostris extrusa TaxID=172846 RepID=A0AAV4RTN0_CAEEX|nr:hypothetical protein CEXT_148201 [Caerostris extrusa]